MACKSPGRVKEVDDGVMMKVYYDFICKIRLFA